MKTQSSEEMRKDIKVLFDEFENNVDAIAMVEEWVATTVITFCQRFRGESSLTSQVFLRQQMQDFAENVMGWNWESVTTAEEKNNG